MKIYFLYTNVNGAHEDNYAFGLATIVSVARNLGHECIVDLVLDRSMFADSLDKFKEFKPDLVGFTSVTSQFSIVKEMANLFKQHDNSALNICGGVHPTLWPDSIVEAEGIDLFVIGEGEKAFEELLKKLEKGESFYSCPNIVYARNGVVMRTKLLPMLESKDLNHLPFPDRDIYPLEETIKAVGFAPFHFARGCPFPCTYCANHAQAQVYGENKSRIRAPSPEYSIREIETSLSRHPYINKIAIYDDIFGLNKKWRKSFLTLYKQRINIPFIVLLRADVVTEEFVVQLKESGCILVLFGVESGNDYIRNDVMKRTMTRDTIVNAFSLVHSFGMETTAINIIGVPGETEEMLLDTIRLNREIMPANSGVNIFYPYVGTKLGDYCFSEGLVTKDSIKKFTNERRGTVLNYDKEWKKRLSYYHKNWDFLVYPFWTKAGLKRRIKVVPILGIVSVTIYRLIRKLKW